MSVQEQNLKDIADAIREKEGSGAPIPAKDFSERIRSLQGGGIELVGIAITAPPAKTSYLSGEMFDPTGMVVTAAYSNGAALTATGYAVEPAGPLADGVTEVTVRYTEGGKSAEAVQAVTVIPRLLSISIGTPPAKTEYQAGEVFDPTGMVVLAAYSDGSSRAVEGYSVPTAPFTTPGEQEAAVSYTENGVTASTSVSVTVARIMIEAVPSQKGSLTYTGEALAPELENYDPGQITLSGTLSAVNAGEYAAIATPKEGFQWSDGSASAKPVVWTIGKAAGSVSASPPSVTLSKEQPEAEIQVTRAGGGAISAASSDTGVAVVSVSGDTVTVSSVGQANGSATITITAAEDGNHLEASGVVEVTASFAVIYGVEWDGGPGTKWTRTDAAALFVDPVPYVAGAAEYGSPFDDIMPWAGMVREDRAGGVEVKEPKYWYKWTKTGKTMKLQIANGPVEGFHVDPVNMDRGDGLGELDFSYIGRYHCASETYRSETNKDTQRRVTRNEARTNIHALGANFWQTDFAQFWYRGMLYLVEYADWNGQSAIGRGCSVSGNLALNGTTDAMPYHTGTTAASRDTYGFTQYRNVEGWWDNVYDWMDGCYYTSSGLNVILNPNQFSDSANGTLIGPMPSSGYPNDMAIPTQSGFEWALRPATIGGSDSTYVPDTWQFNGGKPCLRSGGWYYQSPVLGPFHVEFSTASDVYNYIGCRLQERPPKAD